MSDELINSLRRRVSELETENITLKSEAKDRRIKGKAAKAEADELRSKLSTAERDRDDFRSRAESAPDEKDAKIKELQGVIRDGKHRQAFKEAAIKSGALEGGAIDDLYTLSGYKAEADEPDASAIDGAISGAKASRPYLFKAEGETPAADAKVDTAAQPAEKLTVAIGGSRGSARVGTESFKVTAEQLRDPGFMRANASKISEARKNGTLVFAD